MAQSAVLTTPYHILLTAVLPARIVNGVQLPVLEVIALIQVVIAVTPPHTSVHCHPCTSIVQPGSSALAPAFCASISCLPHVLYFS